MLWVRIPAVEIDKAIHRHPALAGGSAWLPRALRSVALPARTRRLSLAAAGAWTIAAFLLSVQVSFAGIEAPPQRDAYTLGVFPYVPVPTVDRIYGPVAVQLAEDLGRPVHLRTKSTFEKYAEAMRKETYDVILVHPFFYVEARDKYNYLPLARLDEPLTAVVMVREDDRVEKLSDLAGKTIALPPELAAVSALTSAALIDVGLKPGTDVTLAHYRLKPSCLQAVAIGKADACSLPRFALRQIDPDNEFKLRAIFETPAVNNFVFAVHTRVPEAERISICQSILAWPYTAKGRAILRGGTWTRFVLAKDEDYEEVRQYRSRLNKFAQK